MHWTKDAILKELRKLNKAGAALSYNALTAKRQSLVSAAAYHFGSYRAAIEQAGIDYADHNRRPRWTKQSVISIIKQARRKNTPLNWGSVIKRHDELGKAAFASLQPRLFGSWVRALHAAGLDADEVSHYRRWDRETVIFELRERRRDGESLSSGDLQKEEPALHGAATRLFGGHDAALRAAGFNAKETRLKQEMSKAAAIAKIKSAFVKGKPPSEEQFREKHRRAYRAVMRLFGTFAAARKSAAR